MRAVKHVSMVTAAALALIFIAGCSALEIGNPRAITVQDVIDMTNAGVGKDVIIRHIEVTRSRFELSPQEIVRLKKAGVDDKVLEAMVETEAYPEYGYGYEFGYSPYDYSFNYYNHWYPVASHYP